MKIFFSNLLRSDKPESSKRFQSLGAFFMLIIIIIAALFGVIIPDVYIYALVSIALGTSIMTLAQNNNNSKSTSSSKTTTKTETTENGKETSQ